MNNRNKYVTKVSENMLQNINKQYSLNIEEDPQLYELLKGITMIHASKQYEEEFTISNALKNMKYNLNQPFDTVPHGLIQIQPSQSLSIPRNFIFRSLDCIYKTIKEAQFHNASIIHSGIINKYNRQFIEVRLLGNINGKLEFFTHQDLVNTIFKNKSTIQIMSTDGTMHECTKETHGNVFDNIQCKYLTSFHINITSTHQLTLYIPIGDAHIEMHDIYINCTIVENKFEIHTTQSTQTLKIPFNTIPIKIHSLSDSMQNKLPHKRSDINGWYITEYEGTMFVNISQSVSAHITCKNKELNTSTCQSEIFIPSSETKWTIKPKQISPNIQIVNFIDCDALSMFTYLTKLCDIEYDNLTIDNAILEHIYENKYPLYQYGQVFNIKLLTNNYILLNLISQEINKYHNIKINLRGNENE